MADNATDGVRAMNVQDDKGFSNGNVNGMAPDEGIYSPPASESLPAKTNGEESTAMDSQASDLLSFEFGSGHPLSSPPGTADSNYEFSSGTPDLLSPRSNDAALIDIDSKGESVSRSFEDDLVGLSMPSGQATEDLINTTTEPVQPTFTDPFSTVAPSTETKSNQNVDLLGGFDASSDPLSVSMDTAQSLSTNPFDAPPPSMNPFESTPESSAPSSEPLFEAPMPLTEPTPLQTPDVLAEVAPKPSEDAPASFITQVEPEQPLNDPVKEISPAPPVPSQVPVPQTQEPLFEPISEPSPVPPVQTEVPVPQAQEPLFDLISESAPAPQEPAVVSVPQTQEPQDPLVPPVSDLLPESQNNLIDPSPPVPQDPFTAQEPFKEPFDTPAPQELFVAPVPEEPLVAPAPQEAPQVQLDQNLGFGPDAIPQEAVFDSKLESNVPTEQIPQEPLFDQEIPSNVAVPHTGLDKGVGSPPAPMELVSPVGLVEPGEPPLSSSTSEALEPGSEVNSPLDLDSAPPYLPDSAKQPIAVEQKISEQVVIEQETKSVDVPVENVPNIPKEAEPVKAPPGGKPKQPPSPKSRIPGSPKKAAAKKSVDTPAAPVSPPKAKEKKTPAPSAAKPKQPPSPLKMPARPKTASARTNGVAEKSADATKASPRPKTAPSPRSKIPLSPTKPSPRRPDGSSDSGVEDVVSSKKVSPTTNGEKKIGSARPASGKTTPSPRRPAEGATTPSPRSGASTPRTPTPQVGGAKSKIGSLENAKHTPGGGKVKIMSKKADYKQVSSKIGSMENATHTPRGGTKKIESRKLEWKVESKVGSLDNARHRPKGGEKKIESHKLDFKNKAQSKVGSKDNMTHKAGGGEKKIQSEKLAFKDKAQSKVGSKDNLKHKPGGGEKKIENHKLDFKETAKAKTDHGERALSEGEKSPRPEDEGNCDIVAAMEGATISAEGTETTL